MNTPIYLQDAETLFSDQGIETSNRWYHGTSSALIKAILADGLRRSGDQAAQQATKQAMATIGNKDYSESIEPVFLSQSKELAYYWATQTAKVRSQRFATDEQPVVIELTLPEALNAQVRPDVGAASLLMIDEGKHYIDYLMAAAERSQVNLPEIDLMKADRMAYLTHLGMAYIDQDIPAEYLSVLSE